MSSSGARFGIWISSNSTASCQPPTGEWSFQVLHREVWTRVLGRPCTVIYTASMDRSSNLSGIAAILSATAFCVVGDSVMKLAAEDLAPLEVLVLRSLA